MSIDDYEFFVGDKICLEGHAWDDLPEDKGFRDGGVYTVTEKTFDGNYGSVLYRFGDMDPVYLNSYYRAVLVEAGPERINRQLENLSTLMNASGLTTGLDTEQEVELANDSKLPRVEDYTEGVVQREELGRLPNDLHTRRDDLAAKRADDAQVIATAVGRVEEKLNSAVDRPAHYQFPGGVQPIDIAKHLNFNLGNVVKYVSRAGRKGAALEDLEKAAYYLNLEIEAARAGQDNQ